MFFQQFPGAGADGQFPDAGAASPSGHAIEFGAAVVALALGQSAKPVSAPQHDVGYAAERLHVVHHRRLAPGTGHPGEGGFGPRVGAATLQGVDERRFLAADIAPGTSVDKDLVAPAGTQNVVAEKTGGTGFRSEERRVGKECRSGWALS